MSGSTDLFRQSRGPDLKASNRKSFDWLILTTHAHAFGKNDMSFFPLENKERSESYEKVQMNRELCHGEMEKCAGRINTRKVQSVLQV